MWADGVTSLDQVQIKKLSGLSNACYRVALKDDGEVDAAVEPRVLLYRKFECEIIDKAIEGAIFKAMSDSG